MAELTYSTGQLALMCGVTKHTVLKAIAKGELHAATTPGKHHRIAHGDALEYMKKRNVPVQYMEQEGRRILVLGFNRDETMAFADMLGQKGFFVEARGNLFLAGIHFERFKPAIFVFLAPATMPYNEIFELLQAVRKLGKAAGVRILIAGASAENNDRLRLDGAHCALAPPYILPEVLEHVLLLSEERILSLRARYV